MSLNDSLYNFEVVDEWSDSDSRTSQREEVYQEKNASDLKTKESLRKPTEGEIDEFLENVKTLVTGGASGLEVNPDLSQSSIITSSEHNQEPINHAPVQDFTAQSLIRITSHDISLADDTALCTINTNSVSNSRATVSYKPGGSLVKTIFNESSDILNKLSSSFTNEQFSTSEFLVSDSHKQGEPKKWSSDLQIRQPPSQDTHLRSKDLSYNFHKEVTPRNYDVYSRNDDDNKQYKGNIKRIQSPRRQAEGRESIFRSTSRSREHRRSKSRSRDRLRPKRSVSRERLNRRSSGSQSRGKLSSLSPTPPRSSTRNDLVNDSKVSQDKPSTDMSSNASRLYSQQSPYVPSVQPSYPPGNSFSSNMGPGNQQFPVGSMTSNHMSKFPEYSVPPPMNAPPQLSAPMNVPPMVACGYGRFPQGTGYAAPLQVGYSGQPSYPGYFLPREGNSDRQEDSWGMPPPYSAAEPMVKGELPSSTYSSSTTTTSDSTWNQSSSFRNDPIGDTRKDGYKKRKSRSRSRSGERQKSHKKKSKKHSKSPDSLSSKSSRKHRHSKSPPDYLKLDRRNKFVIDPNRIPTPPPPPILRSYDNTPDNKTNTKPGNSAAPYQKQMLDVENVSLSSLLEAVMENSGVGKSQVSDPKVKKEILSTCEYKLRLLYKKRITGLGAFIPDMVEPRQVNYRCSPLKMFHPHLSFNEGSEETIWRCPGIRIPDVKLVVQDIIKKLPEPAAVLESKGNLTDITGRGASSYNVNNNKAAQVPQSIFALGGGSNPSVPALKPLPFIPITSGPVPPPTFGFVSSVPGVTPNSELVPPGTNPVPSLMPGPLMPGGPGAMPPIQGQMWQDCNATSYPITYPIPSYNSNNWSGYNTLPSWQNTNQNTLGESGYSYSQYFPSAKYPFHPSNMKIPHNVEEPTYYNRQSYPIQDSDKVDSLNFESSRDKKKHNRSSSPQRRSPSSRRKSLSPLRRRSPGSLRRRRSPSPSKESFFAIKRSSPRRYSPPRRRSPLRRSSPRRHLSPGRSYSPRRHSPHKRKKSRSRENELKNVNIDSKSRNLEALQTKETNKQRSKPPFIEKTIPTFPISETKLTQKEQKSSLSVLTTNQSTAGYMNKQNPIDKTSPNIKTSQKTLPIPTAKKFKMSNITDIPILYKYPEDETIKENPIDKIDITEDRSENKLDDPLNSLPEPANKEDQSPNSGNEVPFEKDSKNSDEIGVNENNAGDRKFSKTKIGEHRPDNLNKMNQHSQLSLKESNYVSISDDLAENKPVPLEILWSLNQQIRAMQEKSLLNKGIIDSLEKREYKFRRLYCLNYRVLCKKEKLSRNLKIVVPRDYLKEFIGIIHKKFHSFNQGQLLLGLRDNISPFAHNLSTRISAVFRLCPDCKLSQQTQKEQILSDLKGQKKPPLNKNQKKVDKVNIKPNFDVNENLGGNTPRRDSSSSTTKSSPRDKRRNNRSEQTSDYGRPSGYEKATKQKVKVVNDKQQKNSQTSLVLSCAPDSSITDITSTSSEMVRDMKDSDRQTLSKNEEHLNQNICELKSNISNPSKEPNPNKIPEESNFEKSSNQKVRLNERLVQEVSVEEPSKQQVVVENAAEHSIKQEVATDQPVKQGMSTMPGNEPSKEVAAPPKSSDSGLDFKTRIRKVQMKDQKFREIIDALESKRKKKNFDSYLLKAGMLCKKNISDGVADVRILAPPSAVEDIISIIHTMSAVHTSAAKVITFFSKHFSAVENLETVATEFVSKCQQCKK